MNVSMSSGAAACRAMDSDVVKARRGRCDGKSLCSAAVRVETPSGMMQERVMVQGAEADDRSTSVAADTPFEDGTFRLVLTFDESYPNKRTPLGL